MTVVHKGGGLRALKAQWLVPTILVAGLGFSLADRESGLLAWYEIRGKLNVSQDRIATLRDKVEALQAEIGALEADPFALERAIREELELARPGEVVVRFKRSSAVP
jgi:cell division protein FtsB